MADYPLAPLAKIVDGPGERKGTGMMIDCPNCGIPGGVWFSNPLDGGGAVHPTTWQRTGDTPETISLTPSVKMFNHFHSWVKNGMLCVDSSFECTKENVTEVLDMSAKKKEEPVSEAPQGVQSAPRKELSGLDRDMLKMYCATNDHAALVRFVEELLNKE